MRLLSGASLALAAMPLVVACTSTAEEIHRKCATAADPSACEKAEYQAMHEADNARLQENSMRSGGGY